MQRQYGKVHKDVMQFLCSLYMASCFWMVYTIKKKERGFTMAYKGYTESKKECNNRYLAKFVKPTIRMTEEEKKIIDQAAGKAGKSFNRYVVDCALEKAKESVK